jgi:hypothetical protein
MADHEIDLRKGLLEYELRCICKAGTVLGTFFQEASARAAFADHLAAMSTATPIVHEIVLNNHLLLPGVKCRCSCGTELGGFSNETSAILAWRKHAGK